MGQRERIRKKTAEVWRDAKYASVGIEFGISIAVGYFIGDWAQDRWGFAPWGSMIGVLIGFSSGLRSLMRIATIESKRASKVTAVPNSPSKDSYDSNTHGDSDESSR